MKTLYTSTALFLCFTLLQISSLNAQPGNDNCPAAAALTVNGSCMSTAGTSAAATNSGVAPCSGTADDDVWYRFVTGPTDTKVAIQVVGSASYDPVIEMFSTCGGATLGCRDATTNGGTETMTACVTPSTTYRFRVYHWGAGSGSSTFNVCVFRITGGPVNDCPCNAIGLTLNAGCTTGTNVGATSGANEPSATDCWGTVPDNTVWYSFTTAAAGNYYVHLDNPGFPDSQVKLFSGACTNLTLIACNDDLGASGTWGNQFSAGMNCVGLAAATTYFVEVDLYSTILGTFCLSVGRDIPPPNDCPVGGVLPDLTSLVNAANPVGGTGPFACQTHEYMRPGLGTCSAPTVTTLVGDPNGCTSCDVLCATYPNHSDLWYKFTIGAPAPDVWLTVYDHYNGSGAIFSVALYSGTPGGTCGAVTGLNQVDCSGTTITCAGCCVAPPDCNMHGGSRDIGTCTTPISPKLDLAGLAPGTYYLRVFNWGGNAAVPAMLNLCMESGTPVGVTSDQCNTVNNLICPAGASPDANVDTTYVNQSNAGVLGNACNTNTNEPALPITSPTTTFRTGSCPLVGGYSTGVGYVNNVMNNTAIYKFTVNGSAGCGAQANVMVGLYNITYGGYWNNAAQVSIMSGSCAGSAAIIAGWSTTNGCLELTTASGVFPNGDYWIVVDGQDGQLLEYDLRLQITYTGVSCTPLANNVCFGVLPLNDFSVQVDQKPASNLVRWNVNNEFANAQFEVLRSFDGHSFSSVATLNGGQIFPANTFEDPNIQVGFTYYKLKAHHLNGASMVSSTVEVFRQSKSEFAVGAIRPNPTRDFISFEFQTSGDVPFQLVIQDQVGAEVHRQVIQSQGTMNTANLDVSFLPRGVYYVKVSDPSGGSSETRRFIKI